MLDHGCLANQTIKVMFYYSHAAVTLNLYKSYTKIKREGGTGCLFDIVAIVSDITISFGPSIDLSSRSQKVVRTYGNLPIILQGKGHKKW